MRLGIGDDAAVWRPSRSHESVITTDAMVDGVHFLSGVMSAADIGHRALAASLSDVAAMGARPVLATVALGLPGGTTTAWVREAYAGMAALAARHRCAIAGGDIVRAPALLLSVTVVGEVAPPRRKTRAAGRPGDVVAVTGALGASRAGLELLQRPELSVAEDVRATALRAFARPEPRVAEGRWLAASANVRAMMDCSDGLSTDLGRLTRASGCGALVESVPVAPVAAAVAAAATAGNPSEPDAGAAWALGGGEDFELIVTVAARAFRHLSARFATRFGKPLIAVGRLETAGGVRLRDRHGVRPLAATGFDHVQGDDASPVPGDEKSPGVHPGSALTGAEGLSPRA